MSLGFPFGLRAHDYGRRSPEGLASLLAAAGASHAQLAPAKALLGIDAAAGSLSPAAAAGIAAAFEASGLRISVLGCYVDLLEGGDEEPKARERFLEALERAGALGAGCVATESFGMRAASRGEAYPLAFLKALEALVRRAEELAVNIAVEPVYSHRITDARAMAGVLADMGSERLYCLLDPVNLIDPGQPDRALEGALRCVELFPDRIKAMHVKDYLPARGKLSIVPPGSGHFPYGAFFKRASALGLSCDLIIEDCAPEALGAGLRFLEGVGAALVAARYSSERI